MKKSLKEEPQVIVTPAGHKLSLIRRFCKGCEICVSFCPKGVLALAPVTLKLVVKYPEKCTGCRLCEMYCPDFAVFVEPVRRGAKEQESKGVSGSADRAEAK